MKKPVVLTIMDGFGINNEKSGNAIEAAATPRLDKIFDQKAIEAGFAECCDVS